ncbi:camp-regulated D2 protein [Sarocladium strictum]
MLGSAALTLLAYNDLETDPAPGSGAILVEPAVDYAAAKDLCQELSESLWKRKGQETTDAIVRELEYQVFQGNHDDDARFWISGKSAKACKCPALAVDGSVQQVKCTEKLPVLCSQSAALASKDSENTAEEFRVTRKVGEAQVTGYRDFVTWKFFGMRFAPEPKRFEYSTTLEATGEINALEFGADCLQTTVPDSSDDCLFVNVWTPYLPVEKPTKTELKPVLFYIYGGGFVSGTGTNSATNPVNVASRGDVVAVTFNYRVGTLGFLVFDDGVHNGNIATNDQISALKWVKDNIAAFGGDPDRITIAGDSAGAMSVKFLLASPEAEGMYSGAFLESDSNGGYGEPWGIWMSPEQSYETFTKTILSANGCEDAEDEVECLRQIPGQELILGTQARYPVVDGKYFNTPYFLLDGSGPRYPKDIPAMIGTTRDEGGIGEGFTELPWDTFTLDVWMYLMRQYNDQFRVDLDAVFANLELFGINSTAPTGDELFKASAKIAGESAFTCLARAQAYSGAKNGVFKEVYAFNWNRTYSPAGYTNKYCDAPKTEEHPFGDPDMEYLKCHGGYQFATFGTIKYNDYPDRDGLDTGFGRLMVDYFSSFIRTGDPNPDKEFLKVRGYEGTLEEIERVGQWRSVDPEGPEEMVLQWDGFMRPFPDKEICDVLGQPLDYWEKL